MTTPEAKKLNLDVPKYASVEFPLVVKNVDRAIEMIGGEDSISRSLLGSSQIQLKMRPEDPFEHPIHSACLNTENILLEVKVPKSVLRKHADLSSALHECQRNGIKYKVGVAAILNKSFRFRELSDFQIVTKNSKFADEFEKSLLNGDLEEIKQFSAGLDHYTQPFPDESLDLPPPPRFARTNVPFSYQYMGNPVTSYINEHGEIAVTSKRQRAKLWTIFIDWDDPVPVDCNDELKNQKLAAEQEVRLLRESGNERLLQSSNSNFLLESISLLNDLFQLKPIWLRRHLHWIFPKHLRGILKSALPFVAYSSRKGPWRQSYVRFGYDPRTDPNAVNYQVESFRILGVSTDEVRLDPDIQLAEDNLVVPLTLQSSGQNLPRQFIFDGESTPGTTSFHLGDILDPDIRSIIETGKSTVCTESSGWLTWPAICLLQSVMRYKINCLFKNEPIVPSKLEKIKNKPVYPEQRTEKGSDESEDAENDNDEDDDEDDEDDEEPAVLNSQAKHDVFTRLRLFNPEAYQELSKLSGFLKQEDLMDLASPGLE